MAEARIMVTGALGPVIWIEFPPRREAMKPANIAAYMPINADFEANSLPRAENAIRPYPRHCGIETAAAVMPPRKSPLRFEKMFI
jgi:hypothetical protein